jgi:hypothetical protein
MSHYKHVYAAINNTLHHLKQAQEYCDDLKPIDKEACGSWKKELKAIEKQLNGCYKTVEGKHKKTSGTMRKKTAAYDEHMMDESWDLDRGDDDDDDYDYRNEEKELTASSKSRLKKFSK